MEWLNVLESHGTALLGPTVWMVLWTLIKIVVIAVPIILCVAYLTYWERKMIGALHVRMGPNRVGFKGLLQPFADVFKMCIRDSRRRVPDRRVADGMLAHGGLVRARGLRPVRCV